MLETLESPGTAAPAHDAQGEVRCVFAFMLPGEVACFTLAQVEEAIAWVAA
jgi:hypothetical protein